MQQLVAATKPDFLSPMHEMLARLELQTDARKINLLINHPAIYPWVRGLHEGELDISPVIDNRDNVCLLADHGGLLFHQLQPALYEAHTQIIPEGRGIWGKRCAGAALHWLFTRTTAMEVLTKCPHGNDAAKGLALAIHGAFQFTNPMGWVMDGKPVAADVYGLTIQRWVQTAPGLVERGQWFHQRLESEFERHGVKELAHPEDPNHDRYVGMACEMILGGQPQKAVVFYNRFAIVGGYAPIEIVSLDPLAFNIGNALVVMKGEDFWVPALRSLN